MAILIDAVKDTSEGQASISNCSRWNDAVHRMHPRPLTTFMSLFFNGSGEPELAKGALFTKLLAGVGSFPPDSPGVQMASSFSR